MKPKVFIVPNVIDGWSADNRCNQLIKHLSNDFEFTKKQGYQMSVSDMQMNIMNNDITHFLTSGSYLRPYNKIIAETTKPIIYSVVSHRSIEEMTEDEKFFWFNKCTVVIFNKKLNPIIEQYQGGSLPLNIVYIPNGVDTSIFKPRLVAGFVGVKSEYKGYDIIKQACREMDIELLSDQSEYPMKIVPQTDIAKIYQCIDFYLCASIAEGSHNPTMEALATGKPVLTTNVGIAEELKKEGADIIFIRERSVNGIKDAMIEYKNKYLKSRILMHNKYEWFKIAQQYKNLYKRILKGKK